MPLTVRLDSETENCLHELLAETGQNKSSLIRQLIRERWQQRQPSPSIAQQILVDSGILLSYYQQQEPLHAAVVAFFEQTARS